MYNYHGNERLQYFFYSPNTFGAFLCMVIILVFYLFLTLADQKNKYLILTSFSVFAGLVYLQFLLAMTYSRGAYLAMLFGIAVLYGISRNKYCFLLAGSFIISLICTSSGIQRISSISDVGQGSIYNRLLLWHGGTGLIAKNFLSGMEFNIVGQAYTAWYQPLWLDENYGGLISDYLNIAIRYGIFVLCGYLILIFTLAWLLMRIGQVYKSLLCAVLAAAIASYLLASVFSTLFLFINVYGVFLAAVGIAFLVIVWNIIKKRYSVKMKDIAIPVAASISITSVIMIYGLFVNMSKDFAYHDMTVNGLRIVKAVPRGPSKTLIVYVFNSQCNSYTNAIRKVIRPLIKRGYEIWAIGIDSGFNGQATLKQVMQDPGLRRGFFLFGNEDGAKQAIVAASNMDNRSLSGIIALNIPAEWPFDELSPIIHIDKIKPPILFISSTQEFRENYLKLQRKIKNEDSRCLNIETAGYNSDVILSITFNELSSFIDKTVLKKQ